MVGGRRWREYPDEPTENWNGMNAHLQLPRFIQFSLDCSSVHATFHLPPSTLRSPFAVIVDQSNLNSFHRIPSITKFDWPLTAKNKSSNNHSLFPWIILCEGNNYRMIIPGKICERSDLTLRSNQLLGTCRQPVMMVPLVAQVPTLVRNSRH